MKPRRLARAVISSIVTLRAAAAVSTGSLGLSRPSQTPAVAATAPLDASPHERAIERRREDDQRNRRPQRQRQTRARPETSAPHPELGDCDDCRTAQRENGSGKPLALEQSEEHDDRRDGRNARQKRRPDDRSERTPSCPDCEVLDETVPYLCA